MPEFRVNRKIDSPSSSSRVAFALAVRPPSTCLFLQLGFQAELSCRFRSRPSLPQAKISLQPAPLPKFHSYAVSLRVCCPSLGRTWLLSTGYSHSLNRHTPRLLEIQSGYIHFIKIAGKIQLGGRPDTTRGYGRNFPTFRAEFTPHFNSNYLFFAQQLNNALGFTLFPTWRYFFTVFH